MAALRDDIAARIGDDAIHRVGGMGSGTPIRVLCRHAPAPVAGWSDAVSIEVKATAAACPAPGDTIDIAGDGVFGVRTPPVPIARSGLWWTVLALAGDGTGPAGTRAEPITIQVRVPGAADGGGGTASDAWADLVAVYAEVAPLSGEESVVAGQLGARTLWRFRIVRRAGITADARLLWRGRVFNLRATPDPGPAALWMDLTAEEGVLA